MKPHTKIIILLGFIFSGCTAKINLLDYIDKSAPFKLVVNQTDPETNLTITQTYELPVNSGEWIKLMEWLETNKKGWQPTPVTYLDEIYVIQGNFSLVFGRNSGGVVVSFFDRQGKPRQYIKRIPKGSLNFLANLKNDLRNGAHKTEITIEFPKGFDETKLGKEYNKLKQLYHNGNVDTLDSLKIQADKVYRLIDGKDSYMAKIMNFVARCMRVANLEYKGFTDFPNKDTIIDLYRNAYLIGQQNKLQNSATYRESVFQLAECLEQNNRFDEAIKYRLEYYKLCKDMYGLQNSMTAGALTDIGNNYERRQIKDSAKMYYKKAIEIRKKLKDNKTKNKRISKN